ncbi:IS1634 family transposase, partial [uncultured Mycobacterium sp.]|uniref:IS1634 family transposase n=1 Tax=uncultured Mycobacterium sp. TaxID=171292 RepID=UPI0035C9B548
MTRRGGAMHVAKVVRRQRLASGEQREYRSYLLRRSYRDGGQVKHETLANLSQLPEEQIELIARSLKGEAFVPASAAVRITRSLPHGHVAAVAAQAKQLGFPALLGPAGRDRDLAFALIISRVVRPRPKLSTRTWWGDVTLGADLGVADASTDEIYAAMDWLLARQEAIEAKLARRHLAAQVNPAGLALFDLSSSWLEGTHCPLAARGYSRDGKKNRAQIEYGLLTDPEGRPVAVRVFAGNTADPTAFVEAVTIVRNKFGLAELVMVGDRGMITTARIDALAGDPDNTLGWITALRAPAIARLAAADGPLQMSLFDQHDLAEIAHPDYPNERLIACRNPALAAERARKRDDLLHATEAALASTLAAVTAGRLHGADQIGLRVGKLINKYRMAKHFTVTITDTSLAITRDLPKIAAEAALDGIYVIRTSVPAARLDPPGVVSAYKALAGVERDFRIIKTDDLDLRPIHHRLEDRVKAHVLICMLATYLVWHLRKAWAPLTYTDEQPPERDNPVAPATRSAAAARKTSRHKDDHEQPVRDFRGLLDHLATLTRNDIQYGAKRADRAHPRR